MADPSMVIRIAANIAELKKNLAEGKAQIETTTASMSKLASSLSGEKLMQAAHNVTAAVNQIGGAGKLTRAEMDRVNTTVEKALEKYRALGQEAPAAMVALADATKKIPPELNNATTSSDKLSSVLGKASGLLGAFGVGLSLGALVSFGKGLLDAAGAVSDLSTATGVSTTGLQRFAYVGAGVGVSMDEIGRSVGTLSERLAGGDQSAMSAVKHLGLSIDDLLKAGPEEAFVQIGEAVGRIEDPMQKNAVAADLFGGKLSKQLIPMLGDLRQAMEDVPKDALISQEQLQNADDFGDKLDQLTIRVKSWASTQLFPKNRIFEMQMPPDADLEQKAELLRKLGVAAKDNWAAMDLASQAAEREKVAQEGVRRAMAATLPPVLALDDALATLNKGLSQETAAADRAAEAQKKHAAELVTLKEKIHDINQATAKGLWAPKASDMSDALDGYLADLKAAASQIDKITAIEQGGVSGVLNIGVQLDTKDAQAGLAKLKDEAARSIGGRLSTVITGLPRLLEQAFTGGGGFGGFAKALSSQISGAIGGGLFEKGGAAASLGKKLSGVFGASFGAALPGIGQALGSLVGPIMGKLFSVLKSIGGPSQQEQEGRAVVEDFEKQFGSVETMINRVGDAYRANGKTAEEAQAAIQAMWAAEKLGAEATRAAVAAIAEELKRQGQIASAISAQGFKSQDELTNAADIANAAYKDMLASGQYTAAQVEQAYRNYQEQLSKLEGVAGEAARAWLEAHKAADGAVTASSKAMQSAEADLKGLIDKRNALVQSLAAESPEEVMGVIEAQQRGQLAVLDDEIQRKADAYARLADETGQRMADAIVDALRNIKIDPVYVPVVMGNTTLPVIPQADGGDWMVTKPTLFLAGEAGPERATFTPQGKGRSDNSSAAPSISMGELVAEFAMLRADLNTRLPVAIGFAVRDQVALLRGRR